MSSLPEHGWLAYQSPEGAIGDSRTALLSEEYGSYSFPNVYEFNDFITDILLGRSSYSGIFTERDILSFTASKWHRFFLDFVPRFQEQEHPKRSEYWECANGHDPEVVVLSKTEYPVMPIARFRPVDILDMWVRAPRMLEALLPPYDEMGFATIGKSELNASSAICGVCGEESEGFVRTYAVEDIADSALADIWSPLLLSLTLSAYRKEGFPKAMRMMAGSGVGMSTVAEHWAYSGISKKSCESISDAAMSYHSILVDDGWNERSALAAAVVLDWFRDSDRTVVMAALNRQRGAEGSEVAYMRGLSAAFIEAGSRDGGRFAQLMDNGIDPHLAASILSASN